MIINGDTLNLVFQGFEATYTDAYTNAPVQWDKIAMSVPSVSSEQTYGWLGQFPQLREWVGQRHVHNLTAHGFTVKNRTFESTVSIKRDHIADDRLGVFKPALSEMGYLARQHPEELIFGLLADGFTETCFDGQPFFAEDHPLTDRDGKDVTVSNMQDGAHEPWYLLDTSRAVRPIVWQEREAYTFVQKTNENDSNVFFENEYFYGVRARVNAGFGLWQLAFGSRETLNSANYAAARAAMMDFRSDHGRILGIKPTTLVVPPSLEDAALHLLNTDNVDGGGSNPWKDTADLVVTPFVTA